MFVRTQVKTNQNLTTMAPTTAQITEALASKFAPQNYNSCNLGTVIYTEYGDFICVQKPNIYQPLDERRWVFEQVADADGEPITGDGLQVEITTLYTFTREGRLVKHNVPE